MKPEPITMEHDIMTCPGCGEMIYAEVEVQVKLGRPQLRSEQLTDVDVPVTPTVTRFRIEHPCLGRDSSAE